MFVVEDDSALRDSLQWLIASVGLKAECYATAEQFLQAYDPQRPGCLVADLRLPGMSGAALQATLKDRGVTLPVIVITAYAEVATAVKTITGGAVDFIEKPFSDELLLDSIRKALERDRGLRDEQAQQASTQALIDSLTPRERQTLTLIARGCSSKLIASELKISEKTVEVHRANLMRKLGVASVAELIRIGLLDEH